MKIIDQNHRAFKTYRNIWTSFNTSLDSLDYDKIETLTDTIAELIDIYELETKLTHFDKIMKNRKNGKQFIGEIKDQLGNIKCYVLA